MHTCLDFEIDKNMSFLQICMYQHMHDGLIYRIRGNWAREIGQVGFAYLMEHQLFKKNERKFIPKAEMAKKATYVHNNFCR